MNQTPIQNQLIQTICYGAPHGLQVQYYDGRIWTIVPNQENYNFKNKTLSIIGAMEDVSDGVAKILLHSTSKLTEPILEGGKVPIVELAKKAYILDNHQITHIQSCEGTCDKQKYTFSFYNGCFSMRWYTDGKWIQHDVPNQLELFNFMIAEGFNLFNLSEEYVVEKSTLKL